MFKNKIILGSLLVGTSILSTNLYASITPDMRASAEKVIKSCEQTYQKIHQLKSEFSKIKKPGIFASKKKKNLYKNRSVNEKVYDLRFGEFVRFTNEKIQIRTSTDKADLRDKVAAYSSNCSRFSTGLSGFVTWATTGTGPKGYETIYKDWVKEVKSSDAEKVKNKKR